MHLYNNDIPHCGGQKRRCLSYSENSCTQYREVSASHSTKPICEGWPLKTSSAEDPGCVLPQASIISFEICNLSLCFCWVFLKSIKMWCSNKCIYIDWFHVKIQFLELVIFILNAVINVNQEETKRTIEKWIHLLSPKYISIWATKFPIFTKQSSLFPTQHHFL
jgi:hypothetical protein